MRVIVVTIVAGRHDHLLAQRAHLRALDDTPTHVVVSMGDTEIPGLLADDPQVDVVPLDVSGDRLPLAEARNTGVARAVALGAELVVLLDVDCLPGPDLIPRYSEAAQAVSDALLCGPVTYLPEAAGALSPGELAVWTKPHPARPAPDRDALVRGGDHRLFWSLSFALTPATWGRIGGFSTDYDGYGGEDTDFGMLAERAGVELVWVGGADAYHQWHPISNPPVEHLDDILRNAATFHRRWGWWPMEGWLDAFAERGLARFDGVSWVRAGCRTRVQG